MTRPAPGADFPGNEPPLFLPTITIAVTRSSVFTSNASSAITSTNLVTVNWPAS